MIEHYFTRIDNISRYRHRMDEAQTKAPHSAIHLVFGNSTLASIGTHPENWDGTVVEVRL